MHYGSVNNVRHVHCNVLMTVFVIMIVHVVVGCMSGYTGATCQCRGVQGRLVLNGYNEVIIEYFKALSSVTSPNEVFPALKFQYDSIFDQLNELFYPQLEIGSSSTSKSVALVLEPISASTTQKTRFTVNITFDCNEFNPDVIKDALLQHFLNWMPSKTILPSIQLTLKLPLLIVVLMMSPNPSPILKMD